MGLVKFGFNLNSLCVSKPISNSSSLAPFSRRESHLGCRRPNTSTASSTRPHHLQRPCRRSEQERVMLMGLCPC